MCEQCTATKTQIDKFRRFLAEPLDILTKERLGEAILEMEEKLLGFHPKVDE